MCVSDFWRWIIIGPDLGVVDRSKLICFSLIVFPVHGIDVKFAGQRKEMMVDEG